MKEISDIIAACKSAAEQKKAVALVTVVKTEGSSYRRAGARMLVTEDGIITGAISGGCLEGDALRKARFAIQQNQNKPVTYNTADEDDAKFGLQLGCNGIIHVLFEPIANVDESPIINLLQQVVNHRSDAVLCTLYSFTGKSEGTFYLHRKNFSAGIIPEMLNENVIADSVMALSERRSVQKEYQINKTTVECLFHFIQPPVHLVIAGAGNDAVPLTEIAAVLGWKITVADGRPKYVSAQRFPKANTLLHVKPAGLFESVNFDADTALVAMTHNYNYDIELLHRSKGINLGYFGILGPAKKFDRMISELAENEIYFGENELKKIHAPAGIDVGAETAEEIALSIIAEIKAVLSNRDPVFLKNKNAAVHESLKP